MWIRGQECWVILFWGEFLKLVNLVIWLIFSILGRVDIYGCELKGQYQKIRIVIERKIFNNLME